MPKPLRSHRDLKVFQSAMCAQRRVFALTLKFPRHEQYGLTAQSRNSSRSASAGIAEAFRKRRYPAHWISKLSDSESEAAETQVWMETARDCNYISDAEFAEVFDEYDKIIAQLVIMAANPDDWCVPSRNR
jgi:four helix bundle protein